MSAVGRIRTKSANASVCFALHEIEKLFIGRFASLRETTLPHYDVLDNPLLIRRPLIIDDILFGRLVLDRQIELMVQ
jgi:hypothetical protein